MARNRITRPRPRVGLAAAFALTLASGCGHESGPPRLPVAGKVTLDGQPLATGAITFLPDGSGPAVGGTIQAGAFALDQSEGPGPGTYRVEILSVQPTGKHVRSPDDPTATIEEVRDLIPARYNRDSELRVEVKPDGDNSYRFDLTSREETPPGRRVAGSRSRIRGHSGSSYVE